MEDSEILEKLQKEIESTGNIYILFSCRDWRNARAAGRAFKEYFYSALVESRL